MHSLPNLLEFTATCFSLYISLVIRYAAVICHSFRLAFWSEFGLVQFLLALSTIHSYCLGSLIFFLAFLFTIGLALNASLGTVINLFIYILLFEAQY